MTRIEVGRYRHPEQHGWAGWISPDTGPGVPEWALFLTTEGHTHLGVRDERGELVFASQAGPQHPRTFTLDDGEESA